MKILITGGAGYIGGALTTILSDFNYDVKVYDSLLYEKSYRKDVDFIYGDIRDKAKLAKLLKWADCVVWLAALVGDGACTIDPKLTFDINAKTLKWLSKNFDGRIIFTSTCSVYGVQDKIIDEKALVKPLSFYAASKLEAESYLEDKALIFRLGTVFGLSDQFSRIRLDLVLNAMTVRAYKENSLKVFGGKQYRPLLHVKDVALAIAENVSRIETGIYNLKNTNITMLDLAKRVKVHFPKVKIETEEIKFEDERNYRVSSEKAKLELGFSPIYTLGDGIEELKQLLEQERIVDIYDQLYSNHEYLKTKII